MPTTQHLYLRALWEYNNDPTSLITSESNRMGLLLCDQYHTYKSTHLNLEDTTTHTKQHYHRLGHWHNTGMAGALDPLHRKFLP